MKPQTCRGDFSQSPSGPSVRNFQLAARCQVFQNSFTLPTRWRREDHTATLLANVAFRVPSIKSKRGDADGKSATVDWTFTERCRKIQYALSQPRTRSFRSSAPRIPLPDDGDDAGLDVAVGGAVPAEHVDCLPEQRVLDFDVAGGHGHGRRRGRYHPPPPHRRRRRDDDPEEEERRGQPQEGRRSAAAGRPAQEGQGVALLPPRPGMHAGRLLKERRQAGEAEEERQAPAGRHKVGTLSM